MEAGISVLSAFTELIIELCGSPSKMDSKLNFLVAKFHLLEKPSAFKRLVRQAVHCELSAGHRSVQEVALLGHGSSPQSSAHSLVVTDACDSLGCHWAL